MEKPKFETPSLTAENIAKIAELFPGAVTEGKVNFDLLRSLLGDEVYGDEAYEFTWVGKKSAIAEAGRPIRKTLRPCVEESKNWDTTENLYIEGDNLDVLKLLQESYLGKVKLIYIDPPYNTGSDFVYRDNFTASREEYEEEAGVYDEDGDRLFKNTETNGRFHSDWCSMIYPRLKLLRSFLTSDGIIAVSIDDNEVFTLGKIMDEIFGIGNRLACAPWLAEPSGGKEKTKLRNGHEYILIYSSGNVDTISKEEKENGELTLVDSIGNYAKGRELRKWGGNSDRSDRPNQWFGVTAPNGDVVYPYKNDGSEGHWRWSQKNEGMQKILADSSYAHWELCSYDNGVTVNGQNERWVPFEKVRTSTRLVGWTSWLDKIGFNADATSEIKGLFGKKVFETPKPTALISWIINLLACNDGDEFVVLDIFSGAASTAHATMKCNRADGRMRRFIMVQLPEECAEDMEAAKAGYKNICEIGKERIRRAGEKIKEEAGLTAQTLDIGFRVLKLDDTNMKDVYYAAGEYTQDLLAGMEDNIKDDRTDIDLLYACLLDWGLPLSMPHTHEKIDDFTVHTYNDGDLIACFDKQISDAVVKEIAKRQPLRAVFRDSSFTNSPEKINVEEIFKLLAPKTSVKVI
ncbi:MAG: site-specific DNA-methyltransferase [Desulfotomaculaceae bacterium]|nr:site-specific DNA-methyltransferase [Desulfotomaculaceae bacterium]